jgi:hypothetical protein
MKLEELLKNKKPSKSKAMKLIITETQFKALTNNVLSEQEHDTIKKTHLIKTISNAKKK